MIGQASRGSLQPPAAGGLARTGVPGAAPQRPLPGNDGTGRQARDEVQGDVRGPVNASVRRDGARDTHQADAAAREPFARLLARESRDMATGAAVALPPQPGRSPAAIDEADEADDAGNPDGVAGAAPERLLALLSAQWLAASRALAGMPGQGADVAPASMAFPAAAAHPADPGPPADAASAVAAGIGVFTATATPAGGIASPAVPDPPIAEAASAGVLPGAAPAPVAVRGSLPAGAEPVAAADVSFAPGAPQAGAAAINEWGTSIAARPDAAGGSEAAGDPGVTGPSAESPVRFENPPATPAPPGPSARQPMPAVVLTLPTSPDAGFDDGFGTHVAWMAGERVAHAQIRLNPEHVGPIDVRVQLDGARVSTEFHSASAEVRQAIEASLPRLRELLGQQGLELAQADVGHGHARSGAPPRGGSTRADDEPDRDGTTAPPPPRARGLLDEYA